MHDIARHCTPTELSQAVIAGETLPFRKCGFTRCYVVSISYIASSTLIKEKEENYTSYTFEHTEISLERSITFTYITYIRRVYV
jgi:hypothetical protein